MSRDIPVDEPLADADRRYLRDRGAWGDAMETRIDSNYPPDPAALAAFNAAERASSVTAPGDLALREENARLMQQIADLQAAASGGGADEDEPPDYSVMTLDDLKTEIDARNAEGKTISKSGTKAELIARLEADDAASG